ncbi:MAG: sigma-54-dependent Fis family transcriptional regulator, partial [Deltaproteobacteria bacterium]
MTTKRILIIEDEVNMRHMLEVLLRRSGYEIKTAADGQEGLEVIEKEGFHFILCDIKMPRMDGMTFLRSATDKLKGSTVIMMSAYGTVDTAIEAMKLGAYDYISKPFKTDEVLLTLKKAEEREGLKSENLRLKDQIQRIEKCYNFSNMVAKSKAMQSVFDLIKKVADYKTTVLITGESGTGKELIARAIHFNGSRHGGPLVSINCGGIPETLLESELFGYKKGAFTDAKQDKPGRFAEAERGTLFLDEIGELPLSLQVKLLRVLQEEEITPLGSTGTKKV